MRRATVRLLLVLLAAIVSLSGLTVTAHAQEASDRNGAIRFGKHYWKPRSTDGIYVVGARGDPRRLPLPPDSYDATASPDGRRLLLGVGNYLYLADRTGKRLRRLAIGPEGGYAPAWAPGGHRFAFLRTRTVTAPPPIEEARIPELWMHNLTTGETRRLTVADSAASRYASGPSWSPDGSRILFSAGNYYYDASYGAFTNPADLFTISPSGGQLTRITSTPRRSERDADWAPTGRRIVYARMIEGDRSYGSFSLGLDLAASDGTLLRRLTHSGEADPSWSPNGDAVLGLRPSCCTKMDSYHKRPGLWRFQVASGDKTRVVAGRYLDTPDWSVRVR